MSLKYAVNLRLVPLASKRCLKMKQTVGIAQCPEIPVFIMKLFETKNFHRLLSAVKEEKM